MLRMVCAFTRVNYELLCLCPPNEKRKAYWQLVGFLIQFLIIGACVWFSVYSIARSSNTATFIALTLASVVWYFESAAVEYLRCHNKGIRFIKALLFRLCLSLVLSVFLAFNIQMVIYDDLLRQHIRDQAARGIASKDVKSFANWQAQQQTQLKQKLKSLQQRHDWLGKQLERIRIQQDENDIEREKLERQLLKLRNRRSKERFGWQDEGILKGQKDQYRTVDNMINNVQAEVARLQDRALELTSREKSNEQFRQRLLATMAESRARFDTALERRQKRLERQQLGRFENNYLVRFSALMELYRTELGRDALILALLLKLLFMLCELAPLLKQVFFDDEDEYRNRCQTQQHHSTELLIQQNSNCIHSVASSTGSGYSNDRPA